MRNPKTIRAVVAGLRWAAEALERGEIECLCIKHADLYRESALGGNEDTGERTFQIKYRYVVDEADALKELIDIGR